MKISSWLAYGLVAFAAAALSAACSGGSQPPAPVLRSMTNAATGSIKSFAMHDGFDPFVGVGGHVMPRPNHHESWMSPDAKTAPTLLFASDSGLAEVDIYALPGLKLKGQLTGFSYPQGLCSDTRGDVYVTDTYNTVVDEYSHAGVLLARYPDGTGLPVGCAVDPATGDLAVTDLVNDGSGPGEVLVFSSPSSQPEILMNPSQYFYYFAGYGPGSRLWVSGSDATGGYMLSQCVASSCSTVELSGGTLYFPGAVQWDSPHRTWVIFDQLCGNRPAACSYPVSAGFVLGPPTTYSNYRGGKDCDLIQGAIFQGHVLGSDYEYCRKTLSTFNRWPYTAGGYPTNHVDLADSSSVPNGVAVSTLR